MKRIFPVIAVVALMFCSCGAYNGSTVSMPTIGQKGEWHLEGAVSPWPLVEAAPPFGHVAAAVGVTDHVALAANVDLTRTYTQIMGGTYFPVGEGFVWEVYGGVGYGEGHEGGYDSKSDAYSRYTVGFVQGDCGWRNLTDFLHVDLSVGLKTGMVFYDGRWDDDYGYEYHYSSGKNFMLAPAVEIRFGWEHVKFNVKADAPFLFGIAGSRVLDAAPVEAGVGVDIFLPMRNKRK